MSHVGGLSQCKTLLSQINRRIESYENIPVFSFAQKLPLFDSNSTKLKLNSQTNEMMMELLSLVERNKEKKILIVGHSDNTGSSSMNMALSEQRALALRDWLIKRSDITVDNFITKGMGGFRTGCDQSHGSGSRTKQTRRSTDITHTR